MGRTRLAAMYSHGSDWLLPNRMPNAVRPATSAMTASSSTSEATYRRSHRLAEELTGRCVPGTAPRRPVSRRPAAAWSGASTGIGSSSMVSPPRRLIGDEGGRGRTRGVRSGDADKARWSSRPGWPGIASPSAGGGEPSPRQPSGSRPKSGIPCDSLLLRPDEHRNPERVLARNRARCLPFDTEVNRNRPNGRPEVKCYYLVWADRYLMQRVEVRHGAARARGGNRTRTPIRAAVFKTAVAAFTPPGPGSTPYARAQPEALPLPN